jgi:hypothetical protein
MEQMERQEGEEEQVEQDEVVYWLVKKPKEVCTP